MFIKKVDDFFVTNTIFGRTVIIIFVPKQKYVVVLFLLLVVLLSLQHRSNSLSDGWYTNKVLIHRLEYGSDRMIMSLDGYKLIIQGSKINKPGVYHIKCRVKRFDDITKENGFHESNYYRSKGISGKAYISDSQYISSYTDYRYLIQDYLFGRLQGYGEEDKTVFSMLFGSKKVLNEYDLELYKGIGILHLFVVSGLHIMIISDYIDKLLRLLKVNKRYRDFMVLLFIFFIVYLTGFHVSALRSFIILLINNYEFYFLKKMDNIEKLSIAAMIMMLFNPYYALNLSFILGTLCYLAITEHGILYMYALILPLLFAVGFSVSLIYFASAIVVTIVISKLLPFLLLSVFITPLITILRPIVMALHIILQKIYNISFVKLEVFPFNTYSMVLFYAIVMLFYLAKEKKEMYEYVRTNKSCILFLSAIMIIASQALYFNYIARGIHFIDVGQGDSALIVTDRGKTILIDTGDKKNVLNYLRNRGIDSVDYIFISHFDKDHCKMLEEIDYDTLYVSHTVPSKKSIIVRDKDIVRIDDYVFKIVHPKSFSESSNSNSMCIYLCNDKTKILFTGDIAKDDIKNLKWCSDIIKFPHHGSKHSLDKEHLKMIGFDKCVISYGNNNYGHPSPEVISFLESMGIEIFETYKDGSIHFRIE